jgi:hypothetical protein
VKGKSALALSRDLSVSYKCAFVLLHKLREAMAAELKSRVVGGEGKVAEVDRFEDVAEIFQPMWCAHNVRMHDQGHNTRRLGGVGIDLLELVERTVAIFGRLVMLNEHHSDIIAFLRVR